MARESRPYGSGSPRPHALFWASPPFPPGPSTWAAQRSLHRPDRITAFETRAEFRSDLTNDKIARYHFTFDALTGASPNGAPAARIAQTFTRPQALTGASAGMTATSYTVAPGDTPVDATFSDKRYEGGASLEWPLDASTRSTLGATISVEHDYWSFGANGRLTRDLFQKNTTLALGLAGSLDDVRPAGGAPDPFTPMPPPPPPGTSTGGEGAGEGEGEGGASVPGESKNVGDLLVGVTQVLSRSTILQANYSWSYASGYLTDPYKFVAVVQGPGDASPGDPVSYLFESRPDARTKQAVFAETKQGFGRHVLDATYRYMWDDWGVRSDTVEGRLLLGLGAVNSLEPQVRFYRQTAADFYVHSLIDGAPLPDHATGDNRLGAFEAWTTGMKYAHRFSTGQELALRMSYYVQTGDSHPADAIGSQKDQDLFPRVTALMSQVTLSFQL